MKLHNILTFIFLALGTTNISAEYDAVQCGPTTTPVLTELGWQCQPAREGDPQIVYPREAQGYEDYEERPFIASDVGYYPQYYNQSCGDYYPDSDYAYYW
jgi:hypothetical protein